MSDQNPGKTPPVPYQSKQEKPLPPHVYESIMNAAYAQAVKDMSEPFDQEKWIRAINENQQKQEALIQAIEKDTKSFRGLVIGSLVMNIISMLMMVMTWASVADLRSRIADVLYRLGVSLF